MHTHTIQYILTSTITTTSVTSLYDATALYLPLVILAYVCPAGINYYILVEFLILFSVASIELRHFLTFLVRFRLGFNGRTWLKYRLVALKISSKAPLLLIISWNCL